MGVDGATRQPAAGQFSGVVCGDGNCVVTVIPNAVTNSKKPVHARQVTICCKPDHSFQSLLHNCTRGPSKRAGTAFSAWIGVRRSVSYCQRCFDVLCAACTLVEVHPELKNLGSAFPLRFDPYDPLPTAARCGRRWSDHPGSLEPDPTSAVTCHGIFPPSAIRVRPMERTDNEDGTTDGKADYWHPAIAVPGRGVAGPEDCWHLSRGPACSASQDWQADEGIIAQRRHGF